MKTLLANGVDCGDGRKQRGGNHLPLRHRRRRKDRGPHQGIRGPPPVAVRRRGARLYRRGDHAARDAQAAGAGAGNAQGQESGDAGEEARQFAGVSRERNVAPETLMPERVVLASPHQML